MPRHPYNRVASTHDYDDDGIEEGEGFENIELSVQDSHATNSNNNNNNNTSNNNNRTQRLDRRRRAPYTQVAATDEEEEESVVVQTEERPRPLSSSNSQELPSLSSTSSSSSSPPPSSSPLFEITILDFAQQTFSMHVASSWTVAQFKEEGVKAHKVPVPLQRLVYSGKLLQDEKTLAESGITQPGTIVHLFPRPRVVIQNQQHDSAASSDDAGEESGGARVPTIVLDPNEAQQRSQILVLGSVEYMEAQNNVKLFSFMLLVISAIELLNLLALAMGVPQENEQAAQQAAANSNFYPSTDDVPTMDDVGYEYSNHHRNNSTGGDPSSSSTYNSPYNDPNLYLYWSWGWPNTVDLFISAAGVYVALLGIQASNDNTRRLARVYLMGTVMVGIAWMIFNYYVTIKIDEEIVAEQHQPGGGSSGSSGADDMGMGLENEEDIYKSALSVMILPGLVWVLCCLRAAQFHHLLSEAEAEAEQRIQSQMMEHPYATGTTGTVSTTPALFLSSSPDATSSSTMSTSTTTPTTMSMTTSNTSMNNISNDDNNNINRNPAVVATIV